MTPKTNIENKSNDTEKKTLCIKRNGSQKKLKVIERIEKRNSCAECRRKSVLDEIRLMLCPQDCVTQCHRVSHCSQMDGAMYFIFIAREFEVNAKKGVLRIFSVIAISGSSNNAMHTANRRLLFKWMT